MFWWHVTITHKRAAVAMNWSFGITVEAPGKKRAGQLARAYLAPELQAMIRPSDYSFLQMTHTKHTARVQKQESNQP